ncbi:MAG: hypothetical protein ABH828_01040 [archaeon]
MNEKLIITEVSEFLKKQGYPKISISPILKNISWSFDILAENDKEALAIEYRKNDNILDIFIERIKSIKKHPKKLKIYLLFEKVPKSATLNFLKKEEIGIILIKKSKIFYFLNSKDFSKNPPPKKIPIKKKEKKFKPMHQIWVYPCSKQFELDGKTICKERNIICKVVRRYKGKKIPIDYRLPEDDMRNDKKFKKKILENLNESHIFIGSISTRYSKYIKFEIENVFDFIKDKLLILLLKKNMRIDEIEGDEINLRKQKYKRTQQLNLILFIETKTNHIPYSSLNEFENKVDDSIMKMIHHLYKKNGSKSPYSF